MRARAGVGLVASAASSLAAAGCDWREFDDLKKKTPVAEHRAAVRLRRVETTSAASSLALAAARRRLGGGALRDDGDAADRGRHHDARRRRPGAAGTSASGTALTNCWPTTGHAMAEVPGTQQVLLGAPSDRASATCC